MNFWVYSIELDSGWRITTRKTDMIETYIHRRATGPNAPSNPLVAIGASCNITTINGQVNYDLCSVVLLQNDHLSSSSKTIVDGYETSDEQLHSSVLKEVLEKKGIEVTPVRIMSQTIRGDYLPDYRDFYMPGKAAVITQSVTHGGLLEDKIFEAKFHIDQNGKIRLMKNNFPGGKKGRFSFYENNRDYTLKTVIEYLPESTSLIPIYYL